MKDIKDITDDGLRAFILETGEPAHRQAQIVAWIFRRNASSFSEMTDIPRSLSEVLGKSFTVTSLEMTKRSVSKTDGTEKFLFRLKDRENIETVLIKEKQRKTVCISTQVGCKIGCPFCATGTMGYKRDLMVSEIVEQVLAVRRINGEKVTNIVFMGMGEPLDNYDNLMESIRILNSPDKCGIGARKITVSTSGLVPEMLKMKDEGIQFELSVSLHATSDSLRNKLVPVNRKYPIKRLMEACRSYFESTGRVITLEYALIDGVNDDLSDADGLASIAAKIRAKVNLIACNSFSGLPFSGASRDKVTRFTDRLKKNKINVTLRKSRGADILAACGQLAVIEDGGR